MWFRRAKQRERRALEAEARFAQARLAALQMQLNPHFLFNALNAITTLVHTDPSAADNMLGDLSGLLRAALDSADEQEIPLRRELAFLGHYLAIEQARFGDRLRVIQGIEPAALDALVPTFLLQPLVENAIRHGIEPQRAPGVVRIDARKEGDRLRLRIHDSGPGLRKASPRPGSSGIGLSNTRQRLDQLHPDDHLLCVQDAAEGGCEALLNLPFRTNPARPPTDA
jgi:LytS/YehU family sensor histidine kinase